MLASDQAAEFLLTCPEAFPGLGKIQEYSPLAGGWVKATYKVTTDRGNFVVAIHLADGPDDFDVVRYSYEIVKFLADRGLPVNKMLTTATGSCLHAPSGGLPCAIAVPHNPGQICLDMPKPLAKTLALAGFMGQLHRACLYIPTEADLDRLAAAADGSKDGDEDADDDDDAAWEEARADAARVWEKIAPPGAPAEYPEWLAFFNEGFNSPRARRHIRENFDAFNAFSPEYAQRAQKVALAVLQDENEIVWPRFSKRLPRAVIHADLHDENILFNPDSSVALVFDWDDVSFGACLFDVASSLVFWCPTADGSLDFDMCRQFLARYQEERGTPLTPAEWKALRSYVMLAALGQIGFIMTQHPRYELLLPYVRPMVAGLESAFVLSEDEFLSRVRG